MTHQSRHLYCVILLAFLMQLDRHVCWWITRLQLPTTSILHHSASDCTIVHNFGYKRSCASALFVQFVLELPWIKLTSLFSDLLPFVDPSLSSFVRHFIFNFELRVLVRSNWTLSLLLLLFCVSNLCLFCKPFELCHFPAFVCWNYFVTLLIGFVLQKVYPHLILTWDNVCVNLRNI
jgi:hypothetical protein